MLSLKHEKDRFLARYNPHRAVAQAVSDALKSACQHNSLYAVGIPDRGKACVRETWKTLLEELASQYRSSMPVSRRHEADIESIKQMMNKSFANRFRSDRHPIYNYDPRFRISHAQKSLSVFLKHLWCMDVIEAPPQCPVDSIVLERAGLRYPETRWAYVNCIEEHRRKVACLVQCATARGMGLAEWELRTF
jgi:hypothetical protein